jgi:hypothetical protein
MTNAFRIIAEILKGRDIFEDSGVDERIILWHVNPLLGNGLLKHVSEVMAETSIPRQHVRKRFRYNDWIKVVKVVHTATKDTRK